MASFVQGAINMAGLNSTALTQGIGGNSMVQSVIGMAMKGALGGAESGKIKELLASFGGMDAEKLIADAVTAFSSGDMLGFVQNLLKQIGDTGNLESLLAKAIESIGGPDGSLMDALVDQALDQAFKGDVLPNGMSIPGGIDGPMGKMMRDLAKSLTKDPVAISKMIMASVQGVGGEEMSKMMMNGIGKSFGASADKVGDFMPDADTVKDYMDKMMDSAKVDPLNNMGQDFLNVVGDMLKEKNLNPEDYGHVVKDALRNNDVKDLIQDTIEKSLASGDIDQMVEDTLRKDFPFVPVDSIKPLVSQMLKMQLEQGSLQDTLSDFLSQQVEAAVDGHSGPTVSELQNKLMEDISLDMPDLEDAVAGAVGVKVGDEASSEAGSDED